MDNSQVFDHTSVLQFWKKRFQVHEPNISGARRRAVCGDLTSAFNFVDLTAKRCRACPPPAATPPTACACTRTAAAGAALSPPTSVCPTNACLARPSRVALPAARRSHRRGRAAPRDAEPVQYRRAGAVFHVYDRRDPT
ncbi:hypothetical protein M8494_27480 [Serratia ureilytica]